MKRTLSAAFLAIAVLLIGSACQKRDQASEAVDRLGAFAESNNPDFKDKPLMATVSRRRNGNGDVCACLRVCSSGGRCTPCSCSPANCGSCASESELAPIDSIFAGTLEEKK